MIYSDVYPKCKDPSKFQMEECLNSVDSEFVTPEVVSQFGLAEDSENGKWRITVSLEKARKHFPNFYDGLSQVCRDYFQLMFFNSGVSYLRVILNHIKSGGAIDVAAEIELLDKLQSDVFAKSSSTILKTDTRL